MSEEIVIVGAGPAGLAAAAVLRAGGKDPLVIDRAAQVGSSWRAHYERLHLHTERKLSSLPGLAFPEKHGKWVPRAGVVEYLEEYARHHQLRLKLGTAVERIDPSWTVTTSEGPLATKRVIVATGYNHTPWIPWSGFAGELLHSSAYRNPAPYRGRDVLVVGTGNSGAEIAADLVEGGAGRVRVSVRTPPNILRREVGGISAQRLGVMLRSLPPAVVDPVNSLVARLTVGNLRKHGMPTSTRGTFARVKEGRIPILDVGFVDALKAGRIGIERAVTGFEGRDVLLEGGGRIQPEVVIAATGFRTGLEKLVGHLDVLDERGLPRAVTRPGLQFIGYQVVPSGVLREIGIEAKRL